MPDARSKDTRNPTTGLTAQEQVDKWQGYPNVTTAPMAPTKAPPQNVHPSAKGVYGSPIDPPLKK